MITKKHQTKNTYLTRAVFPFGRVDGCGITFKQNLFIFFISLITFNLLSSEIKSQTWSSVGGGVCKQGSYGVRVIKVFNNNLYVGGGGFKFNVANVAKWDGSFWKSFGSYTGGVTECMEYHENKLYVGGNFYGMNVWNDGIKKVASWNGTAWERVGGDWLGNPNGDVYALQSYKNKLYIGGRFTKIGNVAYNYIASFDGTYYTSMGPLGLTGDISSEVSVMSIYRNKLAVAGYFLEQDVNGASYASWDGTKWDGSSNSPYNMRVRSLAYDAVNNVLYAGGYINGPAYIAQNYGYGWDQLNFKYNVGALCIYNNNLYIGRNSGSVTDTILWRYDGDTFHPIVGPIAQTTGAIFSMAVWGDTLYVGGSFLSVNGDTTMAYLAAYFDTTRGHLPPGVGINEIGIDTENYIKDAAPNPARNSIRLNYKIEQGKTGEIKIFSILGNLKQSHDLYSQNESIEINISGWKPGTYSYSLFVDEEFKGSRKFVVL